MINKLHAAILAGGGKFQVELETVNGSRTRTFVIDADQAGVATQYAPDSVILYTPWTAIRSLAG